jgi:putative sterol carrier protein
MTDPVEEFFDRLAGRGYDPLVQHLTHTVRFDLRDGEATDHWIVVVDRGRITVSHGDGPADSVAIEDRATMVDIILGRNNQMTALLRGEIGYEGNGEPLVIMQRLFPDRSMAAAAAATGC